MINVGNLQIELKTGVFMGLAALVLSFLTGIIAGIPVGTVVLRAFIAMVLFTGIGYGAVTVLKKFVPEIDSLADGGEDAAGMPNLGDIEGQDAGNIEDQLDKSGEEAFSELNTDEIPRVQPGDNEFEETLSSEKNSGPEKRPGSSGRKLGKHIIASEDAFKYEPKLMAEAVRTMMSKDED